LWVDSTFDDDIITNMDADDTTDDDDSGFLWVALGDGNGCQISALQMDRRGRDTGWLYFDRREGSKAGQGHLIDITGQRGGGLAHRISEFPGRDIYDKLTGFFSIAL